MTDNETSDDIPDDDDDDNDDELELTPEEEAAIKRFGRMARRYPTFLLLMKVVQRHKRLRFFERTVRESPEGEGGLDHLVEKEREMREKGLDELCAALPYDPNNNTFTLPSIVETLAAELTRPHETGEPDA